jgi:hypothetical protein
MLCRKILIHMHMEGVLMDPLTMIIKMLTTIMRINCNDDDEEEEEEDGEEKEEDDGEHEFDDAKEMLESEK